MNPISRIWSRRPVKLVDCRFIRILYIKQYLKSSLEKSCPKRLRPAVILSAVVFEGDVSDASAAVVVLSVIHAACSCRGRKQRPGQFGTLWNGWVCEGDSRADISEHYRGYQNIPIGQPAGAGPRMDRLCTVRHHDLRSWPRFIGLKGARRMRRS